MEEQLIKEFFEKSPVACAFQKVILDENRVPCNYEFTYVNKEFEKISGLKSVEIIGKTFKDFFGNNYKMQKIREKIIEEVSLGKNIFKFESYDEVAEKYMRFVVFPIDKDYCAIMINDATEEYLKDKQMYGFLEANLDLLCVADIYGNFVKVNKEFENVLGYHTEELEGKSFLSLIHKDDLDSTLNVLNELKEQKPILTFTNRYLCKDGIYRYIEWRAHPNGKNVYSSGRDITKRIEMEEELRKFNLELTRLIEELKDKNDELEFISNKDKLTSLYNRHFFDRIIDDEMDRADINNDVMSLVIFDLDHFKNVNDTWGHPVGDIVLKTTAEIAGNAIRKSDILFRWGGEEFIILMSKTSANEAVLVAEKVRKEIEKNIYGEVGHLTCSFGVAERVRYELFRKWYQKADEAVYSAKDQGRNRVVSFYEEKPEAMINTNVKWNNNWESGNKTIDEQHYQILYKGSSIMNSSIYGIKSEKFIEQLEEFLKHVQEHFAYEEMVLEKIKYPNVKEHLEFHNELTQKTLRLKKYYESGELKRQDLFSFILDDVIIGHMSEQDVLFFPYIK